MQYGQTNGIPQGSVIFDIVAELVLGYADYNLAERMSDNNIKYHVIRYRDDYRIFTKTRRDADIVMKWLSVILQHLNMKFNNSKTSIHHDNMILDMVKPDKLYKMRLFPTLNHLSIQKELLQIKILSIKFPNSGSIKEGLTNCYKRINNEKVKYKNKVINKKGRVLYIELVEHYGACNTGDYKQVINIITSIITKNPRSIFVGIALISLILGLVSKHLQNNDINLSNIKEIIINKIYDVKSGFNSMVHTEYAQLWLQQLELSIRDHTNKYEGAEYNLYNKVSDPIGSKLWNSEWTKAGFNENDIINRNKLQDIKLIIPKVYVDVFMNMY